MLTRKPAEAGFSQMVLPQVLASAHPTRPALRLQAPSAGQPNLHALSMDRVPYLALRLGGCGGRRWKFIGSRGHHQSGDENDGGRTDPDHRIIGMLRLYDSGRLSRG